MGTKTDPRRNRGQRRGLATFVSFLLLFAFALGQSSISALADDGSTDPVASEEAAPPDGSRLPAADAPAEEAPADPAPAEEAPAEEPPADPPADVPASDATADDSGASSGGGAASLSSDGSESSAKSNTRSTRNLAQVGAAAAPVTGLAGGDISLDFVAAGPFTYDHTTGVGPNPPFGFNSRTISKNNGVVESLESGDFQCNDLVTFFTEIIVDPGAAGSGTIELDYSFGNETTGQPGLGFDDIVSYGIHIPDGGNSGNVADNVVTLKNEFIETQGYNELHGTFEVTNLAPAEKAVLRITVHLACTIGTPTGNIQNQIDAGRVTAPDADTINVGQQNVPMKVTGFVAAPSISIVKDCPETSPFGEDIVYDITITNDGNEDLDTVVVTDTVDNHLPVTVAGFPSTLAAGDSATAQFTYSPTANDPDPLPNSATVTAAGALSNTTVTDSDNCTTDITHTPGILITKECPQSVPFGEDVTFEFTLTNTGNEPLENVSVTDTLLGDITADFNLPDPLPVGTTEYTASIPYTPGPNEDPVHNEVHASGDGVDSGDPAESDAECTTDITHTPDIEVTKSCTPFAHVGDTVTYTITVTNTGNEALANVQVNDSILGSLSDSYSDDFPVGHSESVQFEYTVQEGDDDPLVNLVTASGVGVDSEQTATADASCSTDLLNPGIAIVKTVDEDLVPVGTTVTYTYHVTNTGDTTLYDISVDDDIMGHIGDIPVLEPGFSVDLTKDFVVGQDPVTNVATATGEDILGRSVSATDDAVVTPILGENPPPTPFTGSDAGRLGLIAMALLGLGATLVAVTRRRRTEDGTA